MRKKDNNFLSKKGSRASDAQLNLVVPKGKDIYTPSVGAEGGAYGSGAGGGGSTGPVSGAGSTATGNQTPVIDPEYVPPAVEMPPVAVVQQPSGSGSNATPMPEPPPYIPEPVAPTPILVEPDPEPEATPLPEPPIPVAPVVNDDPGEPMPVPQFPAELEDPIEDPIEEEDPIDPPAPVNQTVVDVTTNVLTPPILVPYGGPAIGGDSPLSAYTGNGNGGGGGGGSEEPAADAIPKKWKSIFWIVVGCTTVAGLLFFNDKKTISGGKL